ncbi:hypothetical protein H8959_010081 [Pygathrix nigripes]
MGATRGGEVPAPPWALNLKQGLAAWHPRPHPLGSRHPAATCIGALVSSYPMSRAQCPIQYLHKEFAESWSVPRLAEGFDVSTDVISRVLKSKLVPTLELKLKQDQKVLKKTGVAHLLQQLQGPGNTSKPLPVGHSVSGCLLMPGHEASSKDPNHTTALKVIESNTHKTNVPRRWKGKKKGSQNLEKESSVPLAAALGRQRAAEVRQ